MPIKPPVLGFILQHTHKRSLNFLSDPIKKVYLHFHIFYQNTKVNHFISFFRVLGCWIPLVKKLQRTLLNSPIHTHTHTPPHVRASIHVYSIQLPVRNFTHPQQFRFSSVAKILQRKGTYFLNNFILNLTLAKGSSLPTTSSALGSKHP